MEQFVFQFSVRTCGFAGWHGQITFKSNKNAGSAHTKKKKKGMNVRALPWLAGSKMYWPAGKKTVITVRGHGWTSVALMGNAMPVFLPGQGLVNDASHGVTMVWGRCPKRQAVHLKTNGIF